MKKKAICIVMAIVVVISSIFCFTSINAYADDSGNCGKAKSSLGAPQDNAKYNYIESTHTLVITGTGETKDYGDTALNPRPWDSYKNQITNVVVGEGITYIGRLMFYNFTALTSVSLPSTLKTIGGTVGNYGAFRGCTALQSITLPEGLEKIDAMAFRDCTALNDIRFPNTLTTVGRAAFQGCTSIRSVTYGTGMTSTGSNIFYDCTNLSIVNFSPTITRIDEYSFYNTRIISIEIPDTITSIGTRAFANCSFLSKAVIHNVNCTFEGIVGEDPFNGSSQSVTIWGHNGSTAQTYAQEKGYNFRSLDDCPHESVTIHIIDEPTCTEKGHYQEICDACGNVVSDHETPANDHAYILVNSHNSVEEDGHIYTFYRCTVCDEEKIVFTHKVTMEGLYEFRRTGTCKTGGVETKTCTICGNVDARPFVYGDHVVPNYTVTAQPNCTNEGKANGVCTECNNNVEITLKALGHTNVVISETNEILENGHTKIENRCTVCNTITTEYVHGDSPDWIEGTFTPTIITEARCTINGVEEDRCDFCGKIRLVTLPATGEHVWFETSRTEPTCTAVGKIYYACENCNNTKSENIQAVGHTYVVQEASSVAPTCLEPGFNMKKCSVCSMTSKETVPATGHTPDENRYVVLSEPDCENDGLAKTICVTCGVDYDDILVSPGHDFVDVEQTIESRPGHIFVTPTCTVCGQTDTTQIVHEEWVDGYFTEEFQVGNCVIPSRTTLTCDVCGKVDIQMGQATGHIYEYTNTKNDGTLVYNCVNCDREQTNSPTYVAALFPVYINSKPVDKELGYLFELKHDGIINAKDYSLINKAVVISKAYN